MDRRDKRLDRIDAERRGPDFLSQVREVCRLRTDQDRSTSGAEIIERNRGPGGAEFDHLVVRYTRGPFTREHVVGAYEGPVNAEALRRFREAVCNHVSTERNPELVYRGELTSSDAQQDAKEHHIWLRSFAEYQHVWEHHSYLATQTQQLSGDPEYQLLRHVDKRWSELGEPAARPTTAAEQILTWLVTDGPRFILVLGDAGTGKTFLLRTLAQRLTAESDLVPVLVTMRELTKGRTLDQLLAQHMSREDSYHRESFRYLLRQGKIVLLFDGFDELAQRTDYDRVANHFDTLREAAGGSAKVIVTSRHEYFVTDRDVRTALGGRAQALPGARIMRLQPLDSAQRRTLVVKDINDEAGADRFLALLASVRDLLDLAKIPLMLSFMISWYQTGWLTDARLTPENGQPITAGLLWERLLASWLEHEHARQDEVGGRGALSVVERREVVTEVALGLWVSGEETIRAAELGEAAVRVLDLARLQMSPAEAAQAVGSSTVLVRLGEDAFGFMHVSVLEWLIAAWVADSFPEQAPDSPEQRLSRRALSPLMVNFLCDLAGDEAVVSWASRIVQSSAGAESAAKANAALILQQRGIVVRAMNYRGEDLRGRDLSNQDLTAADLSAADLSGAVLPRALRGANIRHARLVAARLDGSDLTDADLRDTDLTRAQLIGADLRRAKLTGARLDRAVLVGAALDPRALATAASTFGTAFSTWRAQPQIGPASIGYAVTIVPGGILATGHGAVRLWDSDTGAPLRTVAGHTDRVRALAVGPAGEWLASAGDDNVVRLWNPVTLVALRALRGHTEWVRALAIDPAGSWLASAGGDGTVRLWDPITGAALLTLEGHTDWVRALAVDPAGRWLASAGDDNTIRLWDPTTGDALRTLAGHTRGVFALAVDPTGTWLVSAGDDNTIRLWDPTTATTLRTLAGHTGRICALAVNPTGTWLASAGGDNAIRLWDPATGTPCRALEGHPGGVFALAVDPDGSWLASGGTDNVVRLWDPATGAPLRTLEGHTGRIWALATDPAGHWLACAGTDTTVRLFDPATGALLRTLEGHTGGVFALATDPAGHWLACAGTDNTVRLFDPATGALLRTLEGHTGRIWALATDPAGHWLACAGTDNAIRLWDPATGAPLRTLQDHTGGVFALAVDPTGHWLASAGTDNAIRLWDPATGAPLRTLQGQSDWVFALAADPAGHWLASAGTDNVVRLWDPASTAQLATLIASEEGWAALLPDGSFKLAGHPADLWWTIGLCRFDPADLADIIPYQPQLRHLPHDTPIRDDLSR
ncbi:MAG: pentapeptide repeat-containing protein [Pseudonocardiaceae bacterium]